MSPRISMLVVCALALTGTGANCRVIPPPQLKFINVQVNKSRALPGDVIEVSWDFESEDLLASQSIRLNAAVLGGTGCFTLIENCDAAAQECCAPAGLPVNDRFTTFVFGQPCTVQLQAVDTSGNTTSILFDILLDEQFFFTATFDSVTSVDYPRLGFESTKGGRINFSSFLGFFEDTGNEFAQIGVIDALLPIMSREAAFRAFSTSVNEVEGFGMVQGCAYPALDPAFFGTPEGEQFAFNGDPTDDAADAIIFGGALVYDGEVTTVTSKEGGEIDARFDPTYIESVFMVIAIRTDRQGAPFISEIQLGNLDQGLVVPLFAGITPGRFLGADHAVSYAFPNGIPGVIDGHIVDGALGFNVTTAAGDIFPSVFVEIERVDWNMPFFADTNLGDRLIR